MSILLEAHDVSKHFAPSPGLLHRLARRSPPQRIVKAVNHVSLALREGERFGLLGQSGSGKTTLARLLLRLVLPTSGRLFFQGQDLLTMSDAVLRQSLRRRARMIFQHPDAALNPAFNVAQTLDEALQAHTAVQPAQRRDRSRALLADVGLPPSALGKYPHELSGGEKRRVGISRALATDPLLLVADEPVSGLDVTLQRQTLDLLDRLREARGLTLMLITHDISIIRARCDRIGVMYAGRLVEVGPRDLVSPEHSRHPYTRALYDARLTHAADAASLLPVAAALPKSPPAAVAGCPYRPACARWRRRGRPDRCRHEMPEMSVVGEDHQAACHFAE